MRRRIVVGFLLTFLVVLTWFTISFVLALTNPSYGTSLSSRAAEWGRDHGLGGLVTFIETEWYKLNPPKVGGTPPPGSFTGSTVKVRTVPSALAPPSRLRSPAGAWLPDEGVWHPAGRLVDGIPAILTTTVRPDAVHTSYVVGVAWMDPRLLRAQLYSGSEIPGGGPFTHSAPIATAASKALDAAFNAGFLMQNASGGYYTDGRAVLPLRRGAASLVVYSDGSATVGAWGGQLTMNPSVVSVRQNLDLIVNNGRPVPGLLANDNSQWGATLGGGFYVWRSGIGVTRSGALVYAGGPSLAITSLANLLVDAGAVRAMEMDINPDWVQYSTYRGRPNAPATGANGSSLLSSMAGAPSRYFQTWWIRDFYTMSVRRAPDPRLIASLRSRKRSELTGMGRGRMRPVLMRFQEGSPRRLRVRGAVECHGNCRNNTLDVGLYDLGYLASPPHVGRPLVCRLPRLDPARRPARLGALSSSPRGAGSTVAGDSSPRLSPCLS